MVLNDWSIFYWKIESRLFIYVFNDNVEWLVDIRISHKIMLNLKNQIIK